MKRGTNFCFLTVFLIFLMLNCSKELETPQNRIPVINSIEVSPNIVPTEGKVYLFLAATDQDGDKIYYEWSSTSGTFYSDSTLQTPSNTANPCWWKAPTSEGNYTITATCMDSIGDNPQSVDTNTVISVSIYSLEAVIGEDRFISPFAMYLDAQGRFYVSDPGLSAVHYYDGTGWYAWNFSGLDTSFDTTTTYDTTFAIDSTILFIDTTIVEKTLFGRTLFDSPSAIIVDEDLNLLYVADVVPESTRVSVYDIGKMFTSEDTVTTLSTVVTMSTDSGNGVWDTLTDTLSLDTTCLYGYTFRKNDRTDLNFRIKAPYSFTIDPISKLFYISTEISIMSYDSTWTADGWNRNWSTATATHGINYIGKGMKVFNDKLYLNSFAVKNDTVYSSIRSFTDITSTIPPIEDFAKFSTDDSTLLYVSGITVAQDGHIFVTETGGSEKCFHRVVEYDENGGFVRSFGSIGNKQAQFNCPTDILIDSSGKIYVVDMGNHCIKVFKE